MRGEVFESVFEDEDKDKKEEDEQECAAKL